MPRNLNKIESGTATIQDLAYWINERHNIYVKRFIDEQPKPWTDDEIFMDYKFTNAFRQLDTGTIALRDMLNRYLRFTPEMPQPELIFFNIVWYRLFNWHEHAKELGFVDSYTKLEKYIRMRHRTHKRIFTGAHMTTGVAFEDKHESYLRAAVEAWNRRHEFSNRICCVNSMEKVFEMLLQLYMVGRFVAYEIVCDLRFTSLLCEAEDKLTWANVGPGACRGLKRLGMPYKTQSEGCASMVKIYNELIDEELINHYVAEHLPFHDFYPESPFELREVEHSLCEFDKYQRVKLGEGRPRSKYNGRG